MCNRKYGFQMFLKYHRSKYYTRIAGSPKEVHLKKRKKLTIKTAFIERKKKKKNIDKRIQKSLKIKNKTEEHVIEWYKAK